jgi:hypothetical protein
MNGFRARVALSAAALLAVLAGLAGCGAGGRLFATWLSEVSDLKSELLSGNAYAAAARRDGLPPLVAVDETTVEPSAQAVRSYLHSLGAPLSYQVALDTTGRVADGYGVQDQPWFALVSASGKIIWSHDGWLSSPALEAAAKHALASHRS